MPIIVYAIFDEEFTGEYLEQSIELYYNYIKKKDAELYEAGR
jgi:hypothetical protein